MSRFSLSNTNALKSSNGPIYFENNCVYEPRERCHFKPSRGRLPTHIDAFFDVENPEECKKKCLKADYLCRSYSVLNERLCLLTYDTEATRLPYTKSLSYSIDDATTYEMVDCFDVKLDCRRDAMVLRINSTRIFNGKIYSKSSPGSCVNDVQGPKLGFQLEASYNDVSCGLTQAADGHFTGDFVIQHLDKVITSNDIWIQASCQFDLQSQQVESEQGYALLDSYNLKNSEGALYGKNEYKIDIHVERPAISFRVVHEDYSDLHEIPNIGDNLAVMLEVVNRSSPYDIFVRDLVAYDSEGVDELQLIDEHGCPTEPSIFYEFNKIASKPTKLAAKFSAFKFANSDTVQFRTLVSLCIPECEPVKCNIGSGYYDAEQVMSYGRRRRRREAKYYGENNSLWFLKII